MKTEQNHISQEPFPAGAVSPAADSLEWDGPALFSTEWDYSGSVSQPPQALRPKAAGMPGEVFGPDSRLETPGNTGIGIPEPAPSHQERNELMLDGLVVLLFFYYLTHLFRYRGPILLLLRSFVMPGHFDTLVGEQSVTFRTFTRSSCVLGFLALLAIALKWGIIWDESQVSVAFPDKLTPYWLPILAVVFFSVFLYKRIVLGIIAILNGKNGPVENIKTFNRLWFSMASLFLVPVGILCSLADPVSQNRIFVIELIILIFIALSYFIKSFSFFMSRKIPFLQWILYLCAVEIWPVSFYILFAIRGFEW